MKYAATFIAVLAVLPAAAASLKPATCLRATKFGPAPKTFDDFRECQAGALQDLAAAAAKAGTPLTADQLDKIDEYQRAEARKFMAKPGLVTSGPAANPSSSASSSASDKLGGATDGDMKRLDAKSGSSIAALQERLHSEAGDGKNGITPGMADDIRQTLTQSQGSISPDMANLLDAVQKDGGKLTPGTMKLLQGAAQSAKGTGLDLNIGADAEKDLLNHDFDADKPAFDAQNPPASN